MPEQENYLIGNVLELLHSLQKNHLDPEGQMERYKGEGIGAPPDEQNLRVAYELVKFMDEMPGGFLIYYADEPGEIVYANHALLRIFGCKDMESFRKLTHNSFRGMVYPEDIESVERNIRTQIQDSPHDLDYVEYRVVRADGEIRWVEDYGHFVQDESGRNLFYVFVTDSTEKRQRILDEKEKGNLLLAEALDHANRAIGVKDTFLSNMSHDMRTPLNAIFGFTALAKQNSHDPEAVERYLTRIETASQQLLELINHVLEISQGKSKPEELEIVECDLCQTIAEVYDFLLPQAEEKNLEFTLDCSGIRHKDIYGDRKKLEQLTLYLVNNAVTYTNTGKISITARELEDLPNRCGVYQLVVADTGIGISEEFQAKIFEPFSREKNTTLSGIHGIGLGLTIAKNLVDLMGGTIAVSSQLNQGSVFTITLRFRIQERTFSVDRQKDALPKSEQRILLVEDNEINLEIETVIVESLGFLIETAVNGSVAVEKVRTSEPGYYRLILMDIQMPVMDGWQAAREIRQLPDPKLAKIPIIAVSANVFESDIRKSLESGMNAHIPKPLDVPLLIKTIEEVS